MMWRPLKWLGGSLGRKGGTAIDIQLTFQDREAARRSLDRILVWDFDKLVISHGFCLKTGARKAVEDAFKWLH